MTTKNGRRGEVQTLLSVATSAGTVHGHSALTCDDSEERAKGQIARGYRVVGMVAYVVVMSKHCCHERRGLMAKKKLYASLGASSLSFCPPTHWPSCAAVVPCGALSGCSIPVNGGGALHMPPDSQRWS